MATQANIGSLVVSVAANTAPFEKGMKKSKRGLTSFEKSAKSTQRTMANLKRGLIGLAAGFTVGAAVNQFNEMIEAMDELGKTSRNLGIATEELGALRFAAERAGVSVEKMDTSLERMSRNVSQAAQAMGPAKDTIEELGLDAEKLNRASPDVAIRQIADAMEAVGNQADKVRIAESIFGRGAAEMLEVLRGGAGTIDALAGEFKTLGGAISAEEAKRAEDFLDAMTNLKTVAGGAFKDFVIDIAPLALAAVKELARLMDELRQRFKAEKFLDASGTQLQPAGTLDKALVGIGKGLNFFDKFTFDEAQRASRREKLFKDFAEANKRREMNPEANSEEKAQTRLLDDISKTLRQPPAPTETTQVNVVGLAN